MPSPWHVSLIKVDEEGAGQSRIKIENIMMEMLGTTRK
jgi:hypothetical protein